MDPKLKEQIVSILTQYKRVAVVGLSPRPERPSHEIASYLIENGYEVYGVRPAQTEILGRPCFSSLKEVPKPLEIVNVFRAPENVPEVADLAIAEGAKVLWLQLGITHPEAEKRARDAGLIVISNRCVLVDHSRFCGR